jgi:hypothetical protein
MNSTKALLLILSLVAQPAIILQSAPAAQTIRSDEFLFRYGWWGIDFIRGTEKRHIDLSRVPIYTNDCLTSNQCSSKPRTICEACIRNIDFVAWDPSRQRLFFAIATDISQNKPWILAAFDFKSDRAMRVGEFYGGGVGGAVISPSGRYLAIKGYAKNGICGTSSYLMVADITERRIGPERLQSTPTPQEHREVVMIDKIRWSGQSEIVYDEFSHQDNDCGNLDEIPRKMKSVKLSDIAFR